MQDKGKPKVTMVNYRVKVTQDMRDATDNLDRHDRMLTLAGFVRALLMKLGFITEHDALDVRDDGNTLDVVTLHIEEED
jgi:hypothetical protein